jgi:hypothetical protein
MSTPNPAPTATDMRTQRLLASLKVQSTDAPHPAMMALARQSRAKGRKNRRLAEFLRIERGIEA